MSTTLRARAASTYGSSRRGSTSSYTSQVNHGHHVNEMAIIALSPLRDTAENELYLDYPLELRARRMISDRPSSATIPCAATGMAR